MKFHWGTGIFIFLGLFILTLGFVLYKSRQVDNTLVMEKYYEEDLAYQSKFEKMDNYIKLSRKINFIQALQEGKIDLVFPYDAEKKHKGTVTLYRPNDKNLDKVMEIRLEKDSIMTVPTKDLESGQWRMKVDWTWGGVPMYTEHKFVNP
ncbi:MAG: FixH family protein [Saprospiraceae bacterium]|nr:FixH family protein [Saprospiraceae bacterium]